LQAAIPFSLTVSFDDPKLNVSTSSAIPGSGTYIAAAELGHPVETHQFPMIRVKSGQVVRSNLREIIEKCFHDLHSFSLVFVCVDHRSFKARTSSAETKCASFSAECGNAVAKIATEPQLPATNIVSILNYETSISCNLSQVFEPVIVASVQDCLDLLAPLPNQSAGSSTTCVVNTATGPRNIPDMLLEKLKGSFTFVPQQLENAESKNDYLFGKVLVTKPLVGSLHKRHHFVSLRTEVSNLLKRESFVPLSVTCSPFAGMSTLLIQLLADFSAHNPCLYTQCLPDNVDAVMKELSDEVGGSPIVLAVDGSPPIDALSSLAKFHVLVICASLSGHQPQLHSTLKSTEVQKFSACFEFSPVPPSDIRNFSSYCFQNEPLTTHESFPFFAAFCTLALEWRARIFLLFLAILAHSNSSPKRLQLQHVFPGLFLKHFGETVDAFLRYEPADNSWELCNSNLANCVLSLCCSSEDMLNKVQDHKHSFDAQQIRDYCKTWKPPASADWSAKNLHTAFSAAVLLMFETLTQRYDHRPIFQVIKQVFFVQKDPITDRRVVPPLLLLFPASRKLFWEKLTAAAFKVNLDCWVNILYCRHLSRDDNDVVNLLADYVKTKACTDLESFRVLHITARILSQEQPEEAKRLLIHIVNHPDASEENKVYANSLLAAIERKT
jgi:hypothetical protein